MTTPESIGPRWRRPATVTAVAAVVLALVAGVVLLLGNGTGDGPPVAAGRSSAPSPSLPGAATGSSTASTASATPATPATSTPTVTTGTAKAATCSPGSGAFEPRQISVPGVVRAAAVVMPPREAGGVPGTPPLTTTGKTEFAYDRAQHVEPGDPAGNVLLNAHTWPDGTALGNHLLSGLHVGGRIVVKGVGTSLCYHVTQRVEVLASNGLASYYDRSGPPQLAIVVCSGRRLGPGIWTKRTVWFASPQA